MYDFYYNTTNKKYGNRVRLLYTDKDSLSGVFRGDDMVVITPPHRPYFVIFHQTPNLEYNFLYTNANMQ